MWYEQPEPVRVGHQRFLSVKPAITKTEKNYFPSIENFRIQIYVDEKQLKVSCIFSNDFKYDFFLDLLITHFKIKTILSKIPYQKHISSNELLNV